MPEIGQANYDEADIASQATCNIGATNEWRLRVTGTATITSFGTVGRRLRFLRFAGVLTLTHNATTLSLPGNANITTAAGDRAMVGSDAAGNWVCLHYTRAATAP